MSKCNIERWPVIYDSAQLLEQINELKSKSELFYQKDELVQDFLCQGDVIYLEKDFLYYDKDGSPALIEGCNYWVVLGNTCDIQRSIEDVPLTQIIPLIELVSVEAKVLSDLKSFQSFKKFYYQQINKKHYIVDFTEVCTINKDFLVNNSIKKKELSYIGWILFHCCIVRYLARDDGRKDPA
jgi:hypothetical protein